MGDAGAVLVDCGLNYTQTLRRMRARDLDSAIFEAILITHHHGDHCAGLRLWVEHHGTPCYATAKTCDKVEFLSDHPGICVEVGMTDLFDIAGFVVESVPVVHNAEGAVTYMVTERSTGDKLALLYETGRITNQLRAAAAGAHAVLIESNHDRRMLADNEKLPMFLVERIACTHLSNPVAAKYLESLDETVRLVVALHRSRDNNDPELCRKVLGAALTQRPTVRLVLAEQDEPTEVLEI